MLTDQLIKEILSNYIVDSDMMAFFKDALRGPIEDAINDYFCEKPHYRYGGSLAKGTANDNSCDVDLLVYFDSHVNMSVSDIYDGVALALQKAGYLFEKKNSAIKVFGKGPNIWRSISVDVVPGKYSSGGDEKDVYLFCKKDGSRLKSNPEKQIQKIQSSGMKEVIRIIKLLRETRGFKFKSFFLELFAVDIVEPKIHEGSSLVEKLIAFTRRFSEIGSSKVYDPANPNGNDIMGIHTEEEFRLIRREVKILYEVLLTDDEELTKAYLTNQKLIPDIDKAIVSAYEKNAKNHSALLNPTVGSFGSPALSLSCRIKGASGLLYSGQVVGKGTYLRFEVIDSSFYAGYKFSFIVSNAGYEARIADQLRGVAEKPDDEPPNFSKYIKDEHTSFNGDHYVQVIGRHPTKSNLYSSPFVVRVRDFE